MGARSRRSKQPRSFDSAAKRANVLSHGWTKQLADLLEGSPVVDVKVVDVTRRWDAECRATSPVVRMPCFTRAVAELSSKTGWVTVCWVTKALAPVFADIYGHGAIQGVMYWADDYWTIPGRDDPVEMSRLLDIFGLMVVDTLERGGDLGECTVCARSATELHRLYPWWGAVLEPCIQCHAVQCRACMRDAKCGVCGASDAHVRF